MSKKAVGLRQSFFLEIKGNIDHVLFFNYICHQNQNQTMKVEEVPQDAMFFKNTVIRDVAYAIDDDGNYTPVISEGWEVKNDALSITWDEISAKCEEIRGKVLAGELSPLAYHLERNIMGIGLFARYTGQSKWKVKKHLKPEKFYELDENMLQKYAEVLRISIEELKTV